MIDAAESETRKVTLPYEMILTMIFFVSTRLTSRRRKWLTLAIPLFSNYSSYEKRRLLILKTLLLRF
jgi:hypothetical protein